MIATSGFVTALERTKFVFGRGSALDPAGGPYSAPPDPLASLRGLTSKAGGKGERRREGVKKGGDKGKEEGSGWEVPAPLFQIPGSAPVFI